MALVQIRFGCDQRLLVNADVAADVLLNHVRKTCAEKSRQALTKRITALTSDLDAYNRRKAAMMAVGPHKRHGRAHASESESPVSPGSEPASPDHEDEAHESLLRKLDEAIQAREKQLVSLKGALEQWGALEAPDAIFDLVQDGSPKGLADAGTDRALETLTPMSTFELAIIKTEEDGNKSHSVLTFNIPSEDTLARVEE